MLRVLLSRIVLTGFVLCAAMPCHTSASAVDGNDELAEYINQQLTGIEASLQEDGKSTELPATSSNEEWYFRRIWLRVRGKAGVSVPGIAGLQFIPEVEFLWERPYPDGWSKYKP